MSNTPARILVVDDDPFTAELTGVVLESGGHETVIAEGGVDALEKVSEDSSIRLVISDMNMPFMDGIELFTELRQQGFTRPFVLLTGEEAAPLREANPDMDAVMTKDEHLPDSLLDMVTSLLSRA